MGLGVKLYLHELDFIMSLGLIVLLSGARGYCVRANVRARVYDSSYRVEPEAMVSEPESMTQL